MEKMKIGPREFHGEASPKTPEYVTYTKMINRCLSPQDDHYGSYGGRGIKVCVRWRRSYAAFLSDMGRKPSPNHTIDRINVNGHYEPDNCRWVPKSEQSRNTRVCILIPFNGEQRTSGDLSRLYGLPHQTILHRWHRGLRGKHLVGKKNTPTGITWRNAGLKHWRARIQLNNKAVLVGDFHTIEEAVAARTSFINNNGLKTFDSGRKVAF